MRQGDSPVNGPHQGAWVDTVTGQDWFLHFQDVYAGGRIVHLQPMHWENDWPIIGINKPGNDYGEPVMEYTKPDIGKSNSYPVCEPDTSDDFTSDKLGMQWQWNANPQKDWYELTGSKLKLNALDTVPLRPVSDYRNLLLQKWPAPEFTCVTKCSFPAWKTAMWQALYHWERNTARWRLKSGITNIRSDRFWEHSILTVICRIQHKTAMILNCPKVILRIPGKQ